jgi:hypothetical protein
MPVPAAKPPAPVKATPADDEAAESKTSFLLGVAVVLALIAGGYYFFTMGPAEAHVSGKVTLNGQPLAEAEVIYTEFVVTDGNERQRGPVRSVTGPDGVYKVVGHKNGGISPGKYKVTVNKTMIQKGVLPDNVELKGEELSQVLQEAKEEKLIVNLVPAPYQSLATTPLSFDIEAGTSVKDFELK